MVAPKGNDYNKALKTKAQKLKVFKDYCEFIATGKSKESWYYHKDGLKIGWQSMETYIKTDQDLKPYTHLKADAESESLRVFEAKGLNMMDGKVDKCQPAIFQMFMRNKFGWDKKDSLSDKDQASLIVKAVHYAIESKKNKPSK